MRRRIARLRWRLARRLIGGSFATLPGDRGTAIVVWDGGIVMTTTVKSLTLHMEVAPLTGAASWQPRRSGSFEGTL